MAAGPAAAPPHASSRRRTIGVVRSGRVGASAPRHPLPRPRLICFYLLHVTCRLSLLSRTAP